MGNDVVLMVVFKSTLTIGLGYAAGCLIRHLAEVMSARSGRTVAISHLKLNWCPSDVLEYDRQYDCCDHSCEDQERCDRCWNKFLNANVRR